MSDLKSEIVNKVLNQWENVSMHTSNKSVKSFGEKIFEYVKDHPYCTITEVKEALDVGDTQSTASQLKTLVDRGLIDRVEKPMRNYPGFGRRTQYEYYAAADVYQTVNKGYWKPKGKAGRPKGSVNKPKEVLVEVEKSELLPILEQKLAKADPIKNKPFIAEDFIEGLTVTQAKAVYLALRNIFESRLHG